MTDHNENPALLTFNDNNPSTINNPTTTVNPIISSRGFSESSSGSHYSDEEYETWAKIDNELSTLDQASHSEENLFDPINLSFKLNDYHKKNIYKNDDNNKTIYEDDDNNKIIYEDNKPIYKDDRTVYNNKTVYTDDNNNKTIYPDGDDNNNEEGSDNEDNNHSSSSPQIKLLDDNYISENNESSNDLRNKHLLITKSKKNDNLSASDIKQIKTRNQRKNAYVAKFELLKQEETGILQWLRLNIGKEPPDIVKTPQQQQRRHQASKSKSQIFFTSLNRHSSISKARSPIPPLNMPPPVMNDPTANAKTTNPPFSPSSSSSTKNNNKFATVISPKRRRFSFQAITSRLSVGSSAPISPFPKTIEENNNNDSSNSTIVVDEKALNKLCDVLPDAEREVLARYLRAVGGKDELLAVGLYMKDLK
ncbi:7009_t:CDS:2, partial [Entrophospora sp. SA101]